MRVPIHVIASNSPHHYLSTALQPFVGPWKLFRFLDLFTQSVGLLGRGISPSQDHYLVRPIKCLLIITVGRTAA
jgi:hypothetical protein